LKIYGIDFTSAPKRNKPIACIEAWLEADCLNIREFYQFIDFDDFMTFLNRSPIWIAGVDFPLGQPRKLIENLGWGRTWAEYVGLVGNMNKQQFVTNLNEYRRDRTKGDREHLRECDRLKGAISPMKVYGVPVGKMFFEGAPRMLNAGFNILSSHPTDDPRIVIEIYPALIARDLIGRQSYKSDNKQKQTAIMQSLRQEMTDILRSPIAQIKYGFAIKINDQLATQCIDDHSGDAIDAIFAAIQAASASRQPNYGIPVTCDRLEGWICG
jgi:hypothetical protein